MENWTDWLRCAATTGAPKSMAPRPRLWTYRWQPDWDAFPVRETYERFPAFFRNLFDQKLNVPVFRVREISDWYRPKRKKRGRCQFWGEKIDYRFTTCQSIALLTTASPIINFIEYFPVKYSKSLADFCKSFKSKNYFFSLIHSEIVR